MARFGHVVAGFLSMVCVLFLATALGDGRSVLTFKGTFESDDAVVSTVHGALALAAGTTRYGVGVFHDAFGWQWTDSSHPTEAFGCDDHQKLGNTVKGCSLIAIVFSGIAVLVHLLGAAQGKAVFGMAGLVCQVIMFLMFLIAMSAGWAVWNKAYDCKVSDVATFSIAFKDHFNLSYGVPFLLVGTIASLLNIAALVVLGSLKGEEADAAVGATEPVDEGVKEVKEDPEA